MLNDVTCVRLELRLVDVVQLYVLAALFEILLSTYLLAIMAFGLKRHHKK
jgi:hypothetical protein